MKRRYFFPFFDRGFLSEMYSSRPVRSSMKYLTVDPRFSFEEVAATNQDMAMSWPWLFWSMKWCTKIHYTPEI